jgi:signal transduction histidine kinase
MKHLNIRDKLVSLTAKTLLGTMGTFLLAAGILGIVIFRRQAGETQRQIHENLIGKGNTLITNNSKALQVMAQDNAFQAVREVISSTINGDRELIYGIYMDNNLQPWAFANGENPDGELTGKYSLADSTSLWAASVMQPSFKTIRINGQEIIEAAAPVISGTQRMGTIRYGLSLAENRKMIAASERAFITGMIFFGCIMILVGVLIIWFGFRLARRAADAITFPLKNLTRAANTITLPLKEQVKGASVNAGGNDSETLAAATGDEVAVLTESFEIMHRTIKQYTENLEKLVSDRTTQLNEALKELKRSNTELEQFAYIASHDLQEPLRMISSYVQLLAKRNKEKLDPDSLEFINFAVDGAVRMKRLIDDLLAYSRVGTKSKPFAPTDCRSVFEKVIKNLQVVIGEKKASITCDPLPMVMANEDQLVQLMQNLIANALKFCKEKTPEVRVLCRPEGDRWCLGVRDNGIGIAPENFDKIFQIFQRLHTRNEYEGTGIGLAVCKKIVEAHGGRIWLESEMGKGTTFWFDLGATD